MRSYIPPLYPFPWPNELVCGEPYINWPSDKDVMSSRTLGTEVAIPESWVEVGADGTNKTKEAYTLVLTRKRTIRKDITKFVPMYSRNPALPDWHCKYVMAELRCRE